VEVVVDVVVMARILDEVTEEVIMWLVVRVVEWEVEEIVVCEVECVVDEVVW
jgi:hypothetical protein